MAELKPNGSCKTNTPAPWLKWGMLTVVIACGAALYVQYGELLSLHTVSAREARFREFESRQPVLVYAAAFSIYVAVTGASIPGATGLTLLYGWFFGFWRAVLLVSFASAAGATLAFLLSRLLFREAVQRRFGDRLTRINDALAREGAFFLFTLRLIPAVPFFVLNLVMGLTPMRTWTYWWVSQLGMLPTTCVYLYAGSSVPNLTTLAEQGTGGIVTPKLIAAFVMLGLFPWAVRRIIQAIRPQSSQMAAQRDNRGID